MVGSATWARWWHIHAAGYPGEPDHARRSQSDGVVIANLLIMVIGGYESAVLRIRIKVIPTRSKPHVNTNVLKVKLMMAIIGISSIHLLKTFIG
jgi:uncharacterized protein (TIGR00645 family)